MHASVDSLRKHAHEVMGKIGRVAKAFGGLLDRATEQTLRLMDSTVLPEDLTSLELDDHLRAMRRKNLRQLQRLLRGGMTYPSGKEGEKEEEEEVPAPVAVDGRTYLQRTWRALPLSSLTLKAAGWTKSSLKTDEEIEREKALLEEGDELEEEETEEEVPESYMVEGLDTPCQQAAVNARDRVFQQFLNYYYKQVADHKQLILAQLRDEMLWKKIWEQLISKCKGSLS